MTCKDCILEPKCILRISYSMGDDEITGKEFTDIEKRCKSFKNKADFVEVVRCKDCKYKSIMSDGKTLACIRQSAYKKPTDFCSYGERK